MNFLTLLLRMRKGRALVKGLNLLKKGLRGAYGDHNGRGLPRARFHLQ